MKQIFRRRFLTLRFWTVILLLVAALALALRMRHVSGSLDGLELAILRAANWAPAAFLAAGAGWLAWRWWGAVTRFDVDLSAERFRLWLWRPHGAHRIEGDLQSIGGWHLAENGRPAIRARLASPPAELEFGLVGIRRLDREWRAIAPGAVAACERRRRVLDGGE